MRQAELFGALRALQRGGDQCGTRHFAHIFGFSLPRILVHHAHHQILVEAAPVHADAYRLAVAHGGTDHDRKRIFIAAVAPDVAGVDAVFRQHLRAIRKFGQQAMPVVMEVADQRHVATHAVQPLANKRHGSGSLRRIHRDAHQLRTGLGQFIDLPRGRFGIGGIGVGHGLHHNRRAAAQHHLADQHPLRRAAPDNGLAHVIPASAAPLRLKR
jgi:hypothetical protein